MHETHSKTAVATAVLTVSDTRTTEDDRSGQAILSLLKEKNHSVIHYKIVKDELTDINSILHSWCENSLIQTIIINGGTGFTPRDVTYEAVSSLLEKKMDGFGELFRMLSYQEIGPRAMFSRAIAGSVRDTAIYALPGSTNAVLLAMKELILPTVQHFTEELKRQ